MNGSFKRDPEEPLPKRVQFASNVSQRLRREARWGAVAASSQRVILSGGRCFRPNLPTGTQARPPPETAEPTRSFSRRFLQQSPLGRG